MGRFLNSLKNLNHANRNRRTKAAARIRFPMPKARLPGKVSETSTAKTNGEAWLEHDLFETIDDAVFGILARRA